MPDFNDLAAPRAAGDRATSPQRKEWTSIRKRQLSWLPLRALCRRFTASHPLAIAASHPLPIRWRGLRLVSISVRRSILLLIGDTVLFAHFPSCQPITRSLSFAGTVRCHQAEAGNLPPRV